MNSIADKTLKNKLENKTIATLSNMFPQFGFDPDMRAVSRALTFFNTSGVTGNTSSTTDNTSTDAPKNKKHGGKTKKSFANSSILKMYKG